MKLKNIGNKIKIPDIIERMKKFDPGQTGKVKIYHFINILKHNFSMIFD